ncbi:hypothetical protein ABZ891_22795 [Streptomyces sp. NPDC047023]|uniref:hypothetical protein n=1 Tax=Streptomyces sp. NPDC047023 TaxID=3155139 RepID=UPI00340B97B8
MNGYAYANNNPVSISDPDGKIVPLLAAIAIRIAAQAIASEIARRAAIEAARRAAAELAKRLAQEAAKKAAQEAAKKAAEEAVKKAAAEAAKKAAAEAAKKQAAKQAAQQAAKKQAAKQAAKKPAPKATPKQTAASKKTPSSKQAAAPKKSPQKSQNPTPKKSQPSQTKDYPTTKSKLSEHLRQTEKYGQGSVRDLPDGRIRYYGKIDPARNPGEMIGRRLVREWNPVNGNARTWHETIDGAGRIRQVRPDVKFTGGRKVHYVFDILGKFTKSW